MASIIGKYSVWTWFNTPRVTQSGSAVFFGAWSGLTVPVVYRLDLLRKSEIVATIPQTTLIETDDHNEPALLATANGKLLACWSSHGTTASYSARTTSGTDIRAWTTPQTVGGNLDSYAHLFQANDANKTIYWFYRRHDTGTHKVQRFRTSTNDGDTWGNDTTWIDEPGERPYFRYFPANGNRLDFAVNNCGLDEGNVALYHGYIAIATNGTRTYHKSDGTLVGTDANLPFRPQDFTLVRDATSDDWVVMDCRVIDGTPVILSQRGPGRDWSIHEYWRSKWNGSSWDSEKVVNAYESGAHSSPDPSTSPGYTGLAVLDPANADVVYASRAYTTDTDFRVETYTRSGSWSKTADLSGATSNKNCRPVAFRFGGDTYVLWWSGTYNSYSSYNTDVYIHPTLPLRSVKLTAPQKRTKYLPAGTKLYLPLQEASGAPTDLIGTYTTSVTGSVTRNSTAFGYNISGWSTSNYITFDALGADWTAASYPKWCAVLFSNTNTSAAVPFSLGDSAGSVPYAYLAINTTQAQEVSYSLRGDTGSAIDMISAATKLCNDGNLHVLMGASFAANSHAVFWDGALVQNSSTTLPSSTPNRATIGCLRRNTNANGFNGNVYTVLVGWGAVPSPADLYLDLVNGRFSGTLPIASRPLINTGLIRAGGR